MSTAKARPGGKTEPPMPREGTGWAIVSYLIGGMLLYGGIGWLGGGGAPNGARARGGVGGGTGWAIVSYLIGGMLLYGGIGWLVGRWTHIEALTGVGIVVGIGLSLALIFFRFTRPPHW